MGKQSPLLGFPIYIRLEGLAVKSPSRGSPMPSHGNQSSEFHKPSNFLPEQAQEREPRVWWDTVMFLRKVDP